MYGESMSKENKETSHIVENNEHSERAARCSRHSQQRKASLGCACYPQLARKRISCLEILCLFVVAIAKLIRNRNS